MSPKNQASIPALVALIGATLFLLACGGGGTSATATPPAKNADSAVAAEFTLPDVRGEKFNLSDTAGQVRLIDFWATWCAPCREEVPMFKELHQLYGDRGFTIIAISDSPASPIIRASDHGFVIDADTPQFFPSSISTIALLETLMAFVIADAEPQVISNIERFHVRRHKLGIYSIDE